MSAKEPMDVQLTDKGRTALRLLRGAMPADISIASGGQEINFGAAPGLREIGGYIARLRGLLRSAQPCVEIVKACVLLEPGDHEERLKALTDTADKIRAELGGSVAPGGIPGKGAA